MSSIIHQLEAGEPFEVEWDDTLHLYCCGCGMCHLFRFVPTDTGFFFTADGDARRTAMRRYRHDGLFLKHGDGKWKMVRVDNK